jgi:hypothetical protein
MGFQPPRSPPDVGGLLGQMGRNAISTGQKSTQINVPVKLSLDGRILAESVQARLADLFEFPSQAGSFNSATGSFPSGSQASWGG